MSSDISGAAGLAGRYATALYELADADKQLDQVAGDLAQVQAMIDGSDDLVRLIRSPVISRDNQTKAMAAVLEQAEISELTRKFVGTVSQNRRLFALPAMIREFRSLLAKRRGEVTAEVTSAQKLTQKQQKAIESALKKAIGSAVAVEASVDQSLLGGLVVKVGSRMIDSSVKTKLQQLRLAMKGIG